jgi:hypothetical protein
MPAPNDHPRAPKRRDRPSADLPREESALDQALREVMAEATPKTSGPPRHPDTASAGATPEAVVTGGENDTTPSELDLTGTPTRPAPEQLASAPVPTAFPPGENTPETDRREPMVIEALLLQIPGVDALAVFKLASAGLNRFASLLKRTPAELARHAGLPLDVAQRVLAELSRWSGGLHAPAGGEPQAAAWRSLEPLLAELEQHHATLERATSGWSKDQVSIRRRVRQERDRVYMSIKAALASIGELDLLLRMEKLAFAKRIDELHRLLRAGAAAGVLTSGRKGPNGDPPNGRTHP